ncbi:hypothetical protein [Rhizomonospora bruguierae]|uniref:hypothetical protein n=1 Tax=Rhizomonospora bruguierae TaxID=1581705 RepID=UPI001BD165BD|nr:hypothetical protein [Micromonospora sp. NBRC 107566]
MTTRKVPQDHLPKKKTAAQREAEGETTVTIEWEGHEFVVPTDPEDWPTGAMRAFEDGKAFTAIRALIGAKRYDRLGIDSWPNRKTTGLFEKFAEAAGLDDAGN